MPDYYSSPEFEKNYTYPGTDLGITLDKETVCFRLWAPTARSVSIRIYESGTPGTQDLLLEKAMQSDICGTWTLKLDGNYQGFYYTYLVCTDGITKECCDPYAISTGVNGKRAMILDLKDTDPAGWDCDTCCHRHTPMSDHIIYEVHIRDISIHPSSGVTHKGKYLGLCERSTSLPCGTPTALDHILDLGITHVQLQPIYDFGSVDESGDLNAQYNWGYDPVNYNVPEGSYATDPYNGEVRVRELKTLIHTLHRNGLGVYMDVVYNHVYSSDDFCFNNIVPGYFSRPGSNGSGCGNDTASERSMVRKYIVDSLCHWVREYHIDGFRFDLAGLIDVDTIREAMTAIHKTHPYVRFYGEGWHMDSLTTKADIPMTDQTNSKLLPDFGFFNDTFRDLLRGSVFSEKEKGFLTGKTGSKNALRSCFMGVTPWACSPLQSINYISCHDNHTLYDRLTLGHPRASHEDIIRRCRLGAAFTMLSQGVPFLLAGEEMLRSKPIGDGKFDENSYRSPDCINAIRWSDLNDQLTEQQKDYYKGLIQFRNAHPCLRLTQRNDVYSGIRPIPCQNPHLLVFALNDVNERIITIFNNGTRESEYTLPDGSWSLHIDSSRAGNDVLATVTGKVSIPPVSAMVLVQNHTTHPTEVVAAMIQQGNRFLLCQRPACKARGLMWEFPGGKVEHQESAREALIRECREELGIDVQVHDQLAQTEHMYPDIRIRLTLFRCTADDQEPESDEHSAMKWITWEEFGSYPLSPADAALCEQMVPQIK